MKRRHRAGSDDLAAGRGAAAAAHARLRDLARGDIGLGALDVAEGQRPIRIGRYGLTTPAQARQAAWEILSAVAKGIDPVAPAPDRNAITVSALCDWYLAEAAAGRILGRRRRPIKASTLAMDRSRIEVHIKPLLGALTCAGAGPRRCGIAR